MVSKATVIKAIVVSLCALGISGLGGLLAFLIQYFYTDVYDVSPIHIEIIQNDNDARNATTRITHSGKQPITDLHFTLKAPKAITNYTSFTSLRNMALDNSSNMLNVDVSKFGLGSGSIIEIYTSINTNRTAPPYGNYSAYAVYEQGSVKYELRSLPWEETSNQFNMQSIIVRKSVLVVVIIIVLSIIAWLISRFYDSLKVIYRDARRRLK